MTDQKTYHLTLPRNALQAALLFAGVNGVRYYINSVYIEPARLPDLVRVVATDGHRALVQEVDCIMSTGMPPIILDAPTLALAVGKYAAKEPLQNVVVTYTAGAKEAEVMNQATGTYYVVGVIDAKYPDYRRALPHPSMQLWKPEKPTPDKPHPEQHPRFNPRYLTDLVTAGRMLAGLSVGKDKGTPPRMDAYDMGRGVAAGVVRMPGRALAVVLNDKGPGYEPPATLDWVQGS